MWIIKLRSGGWDPTTHRFLRDLSMLRHYTPDTIKTAWNSATPTERSQITEFLQAQSHLYDDDGIVYFLITIEKPVKNRGSTELRKVISAGCGFVFNRGIYAREIFPLLGITPGKAIKRPPLSAAKEPRPSFLPKKSVLLPQPKPTIAPPSSPPRKTAQAASKTKSIAGIQVKVRR